MSLRDREIERIEQIISDRPYWAGGVHMLGALGVGDGWQIRRRGFRDHLKQLGNEPTDALLSYFELRAYEHTNVVWPVKGLQLFVSHRDDQRANLAMLASALKQYGIAAFLAHDAIIPGRDWREELIVGLGSMNALLAYCSAGFAASEWTGQEVGFAFGKGVPVVTILAGENPRALLDRRQGIRGTIDSEQSARQMAERIFAALAAEATAKEALSIGLAWRLKFAGSWDAAADVTSRLIEVGRFAPAAIRDIRLALDVNDQIPANEELLELLGDR